MLFLGFRLGRGGLCGLIFALHVSFSTFTFFDLVGLLSHKFLKLKGVFQRRDGRSQACERIGLSVSQIRIPFDRDTMLIQSHSPLEVVVGQGALEVGFGAVGANL